MTNVLPPLDIRKIRFIPLSDPSILANFECGEREIDRNIGKCCGWQDKHRVRVFCAVMEGGPLAYGFYSLGISAEDANHLGGRSLLGHEDRAFVPFVYINYLAVRQEFQKQKLGTLLLIDALRRCALVARNVGFFGVALHAMTDHAAGLYDRYGFQAYDEKMKYPFMVLPIQTLFEVIPPETSTTLKS